MKREKDAPRRSGKQDTAPGARPSGNGRGRRQTGGQQAGSRQSADKK